MGWSILTDLSGVVEVTDGYIKTEVEALENLILHLESNKTEIVDKIASAKKRLRRIRRKT